MNELQIFSNEQFGQIRTVTIDGELWAVGKDVATALGYSNTKDALWRHVYPEDKRGSRFPTPSGEQEMTIINESGIYSLIFSSKLPAAKEFKHWVTSEILPAVRRTGTFSALPDRSGAVNVLSSYMKAKTPADKLVVISFARNAGYGSETLDFAEKAIRDALVPPSHAPAKPRAPRKTEANRMAEHEQDYQDFAALLAEVGEPKRIYNRDYIMIPSAQGRELADSRKVNYHFFLKWARENGILEPSADGKSVKSVRFGDKICKCVCLLANRQ